jgi:hypothetical protein
MDPDSPFAPTAAEHRFGPLLDQEIADRIANATHFPLIDAIVARHAASGDSRSASRPGGAINVSA